MFKLLKLYRFFVPNLTVISMGGGSSTSAATLTPEQKELLSLQTGQLRDVFMPAYTSTVQGAKDTYNTLSPYANQAALNTFNTATDVGGTQRGIAGELAAGARNVGGAGAVVAIVNGTAVTFAAVPVGTILEIRATRVNATGTAATNLVALY